MLFCLGFVGDCVVEGEERREERRMTGWGMGPRYGEAVGEVEAEEEKE